MAIAPERLRLHHVVDQIAPEYLEQATEYLESFVVKHTESGRPYRVTARGFRVYLNTTGETMTPEEAFALTEEW